MGKGVPKSLRKLTIADKKRFVELFNQGATNNAYFSYLALNIGEVDYLKEHIDEIKKEVTVWEAERTRKQVKAQEDARLANELAQKNGVVINTVKTKKSKSGWTVPTDKELQFKKDAAARNLPYMLEHWCSDKEALLTEIARLEKK